MRALRYNPDGVYLTDLPIVHLIKGWRGPGHPDEAPLCGASDETSWARTEDRTWFEAQPVACSVCRACAGL